MGRGVFRMSALEPNFSMYTPKIAKPLKPFSPKPGSLYPVFLRLKTQKLCNPRPPNPVETKP